MKTAYSYVRWSTKSQGDKGRDSHTRQTQSAKQWIQDYGNGEYVLSEDNFIDSGKSGYKGEHLKEKGDLKRFLDEVKAGKIKQGSILLVDDYSRLSRIQPFEALELFSDIIRSGIGVVFTGSFDKRVVDRQLLNNPATAHVFQQIFYGLIQSHAESAEKGRKVKLAKNTMLNNIRNGLIQRNNLPKYFTFVPNQDSKSIGKYIHNDKTPLVKELIQMFLGGKSLYAIADHFNSKGVLTFKGFQWSGNGVSHILRDNRLLIGEYKAQKNFVPAIIDHDTYNKIQNLLKQNTFTGLGKKAEISNIFRGMCFCSECGHTMNVLSPYNPKDKTQRYRYVRCSRVNQGKTVCKNKSMLRLDEMEQEFFFNYIMKNPQHLVSETDNKEMKALDKKITTTQTNLNEITKKIEAATDLLGVVSNDELKKKMAKLNSEREGLQTELDNLNFQRSKIQDATHNFTDIQKLLLDMKTKSKKTKLVLKKDENGEEYFTDGVDVTDMDEAVKEIQKSLKDEFVREGVRVMLPSLIGKITVDGNKGQFFVYNRSDKLVYESFVYESNRNNSESWKEKVRVGLDKYWSKKRKQKK